MICQIGDRNVVIDCAANQPGDVLQRREDDEWRDFLLGGESVVAPIDVYTLPPGQYRLVPDRGH